jgi:LysR family transcriptional regulator, regulator for bpeEF and oprC
VDRLDTMELFARIARCGSFSRAADAHGIARASATERIAALERRLGVRLLNRTRRNVALTSEGVEYLKTCESVLQEIEEAEAVLGNRADQALGLLRVSANSAVARCLILPHLRTFTAAHPGIRLQMVMSEARADFVREGIEVAVRIGGLEDQDLICRPLGRVSRVTVASPKYLAEFGAPREPQDIARHRTIEFLLPGSGQTLEWEFASGGQVMRLRPNGSLALSDPIARVEAAVSGIGITQTLSFIAQPYLSSGRLARVLERHDVLAPPISALYAPTRHVPARVRVFLEFLSEVVGSSAVESKLAEAPM